MNPQEAFINVVAGLMERAAAKGELNQIQTVITPQSTGKRRVVRIIIVPEDMDRTWPADQPLGTDEKKN